MGLVQFFQIFVIILEILVPQKPHNFLITDGKYHSSNMLRFEDMNENVPDYENHI